ncbi:hypothetical protein DW036_22905 [Bacteroides sp. AF39-11AC]|nr:hypothetical protein DW036_22905 [Bacteroides sp. AF39-11AC]
MFFPPFSATLLLNRKIYIFPECSATCLKRIRTVLAPYILRSKVPLHGESTALVRSKCISGTVRTNTFLLY